MSEIKLSICMPTYNFGPFIGETLDSIIPQLQQGVEIVILDGASTDNTQEVVQHYQSKCPQIRYIRQSHKGGIDRDMSTSIDKSEGEYFWLFSSDDIMKPDALKTVLSEIKSGLDVYLCGLTLCDKQMNIICDHKISDALDGQVFDLTQKAERELYFSQAITTTAFFSFMGSLIMKRSWWNKYPFDEMYDRTCWAHVARMMKHVSDEFRLKYIKSSLQLKRGDNDSFMDKGLVHRYSIAIDGYHNIADKIFGGDALEAFHLRRVIVNEFPPKAMFFARIGLMDLGKNEERLELDRLVHKAYIDKSIRNYLYLIIYNNVPLWLYRCARSIYRSLRKLLNSRGRVVQS